MAKVSLLLFSLFIIVASAIINGSEAVEKVGIYELKKGDLSVKFTNWGATIVSVFLPDKYGKMGDIVLGYDSINDYKNDTSYIGSVVGRVANRIGGAQFTLNGVHYKLIPNEGKNMLHGGPVGFSDVVWKVNKYKKDGYAPSIVFAYDSYDGEEGFPGALRVTVTYTLYPGNRLTVRMKAKALNKATPVNLAQHTYWNLGNHNSGDILSEQLKKAAVVKDKKSGRVMELFTNQAGVQFYTANFLKDVRGKGGYVYESHGALCLETQAFPDSVNHPNFPSVIVYPGKEYKHVMVFKFSISS
uniref:Aldose 1-epimerase n=1 Tax=Gossypium raimondii TaxID=29730 RepID=A0A0D2V278_GOSRA|nr:hypothetical protein B456_012G055600 [Gossypium raimondii]